MTTITESDLRDLRTNPRIDNILLNPVFCDRWRVVFNSLSVENSNQNILTARAVRCNTDYLNNTISFEIQSSSAGEEHIAILALVKKYFTVRVDALDGDRLLHSVVGVNAKITNHEYKLDYAINQPAVHELTIKVAKFQIMELKKQPAKSLADFGLSQ